MIKINYNVLLNLKYLKNPPLLLKNYNHLSKDLQKLLQYLKVIPNYLIKPKIN